MWYLRMEGQGLMILLNKTLYEGISTTYWIKSYFYLSCDPNLDYLVVHEVQELVSVFYVQGSKSPVQQKQPE